MALTTAAEYKAFLNYSGTDRDTWIAAMLPVAQRIVEKICGRPSGGFESATWTQDFDGRGGYAIKVPCWPVTSITSVSCRDSSGDLTALDTESYWISDDARFVERSGSQVSRGYNDPNTLNDDPGGLTGQSPAFADGNKNYRIVYVGGYASNAIDSNLKLACWKLLDNMWATKGESGDLKSESDGHYSYTRSDGGVAGDGSDPMGLKVILSDWVPLT
jgi:hypothetical protein